MRPGDAAPRDPIVSVVIPTRNRPELLQAALASALDQAFGELEVIIVDEASSPPVDDVLAAPDPRVRIIRNEQPRGPAAARNQGAAASRAPYIAFLDDDDRWLQDKVSRVLACFERNPEAGAVFHRTVPDGHPIAGDGSCRLLDDPVRRMLTEQPPHLDSVVVRREVHERVEFDEGFRAAEDLDYMLRVSETTPMVELDLVLAILGRGAERFSEIKLDDRIAARERFRAKHARRFEDSEVRAFYYVRLGHLYRRSGRRTEALAAFLRALRAKPSSARPWKGLVILLLPKKWLPSA
ncbi:MAG: glycosyltransferase [Acidimicrobiia bacterium]